MNEMPRFTGGTLLMLLLVLGCAGGTRGWYVAICTDNGEHDPALLVQGPGPRYHFEKEKEKAIRGRTPATQLDNLVANLAEQQRFECKAPLANAEETTAHLAPGYPLLFGLIASRSESADLWMRWLQCALGTLTAGCYFFFTRRAFHSTIIATLAGLLCAFHPFWIINTAELNDGVLISFLVGVSLALGARGGQTGGAFTGLCFGIALAGVAMTRAAFLPFTIVALLWYLCQCRHFSVGWFAGFLAIAGFVNGLAPWSIRNYQVYERPIPIATSTYLHLWMGNHPLANGAALEEPALRATLSDERRKALLDEPDQAKRYNQLSDELLQQVQDHPTDTLRRRIQAGNAYLLGERWLNPKHRELGQRLEKNHTIVEPPEWLDDSREFILHGTLLGMLILAFLGWRWSYAWHQYGGLAAVAVLFLPLPYLLSHAEHLSGPRLPLDGVLLCLAAFALASLIPGVVDSPESAATSREPDSSPP